MAAPVARLLPLLLLLLLPSPLRDYLSTSQHQQHAGAANQQDNAGAAATTGAGALQLQLHPIVLIPGASCPHVEARLTEAYRPSVPRCGAMVGHPWFGLWENASDVPAHDYLDCFKEQISLVYDPATNDYRNPAGVETRIPNFGSPSGFTDKKPLHPDWCLAVLRDALERIGYVAGETLFGAPYDLRHAPPAPGQSSNAFSVYFDQLTRLVENASGGGGKKKKKKKVILFGHSYGGGVALEFVRSKTPAWRREHVKHLFLVAPTIPAHGFVEALRNLIEGTDMLFVPGVTPMSLRATWRSFETAMANIPSRLVFGHDTLVITRERNYTAYDMEKLLTAIGFAGGVEPYRRRQLPRTTGAPLVPVTCINGVGKSTPRRLVYWDGDFDVPAEFVYGDGDGKVNVASMLAFNDKMRQNPAQKKMFRSIFLAGVGHSDIVTAKWSLKRVVQEIQQANRVTSS